MVKIEKSTFENPWYLIHKIVLFYCRFMHDNDFYNWSFEDRYYDLITLIHLCLGNLTINISFIIFQIKNIVLSLGAPKGGKFLLHSLFWVIQSPISGLNPECNSFLSPGLIKWLKPPSNLSPFPHPPVIFFAIFGQCGLRCTEMSVHY